MKFHAYRPQIQFKKNGIEVLASTLLIILWVLGCLLLAHWAWVLFPLASVQSPPKLEQNASSQLTDVLSAHWFKPVNGQKMISLSTVNFKLVGIYASTIDTKSFAVFKLADGKQKSVLINQEISSGILLQNVDPDYVAVGQQGNTQNLYLENKKSSLKSIKIVTPVIKIQ